jgi:fibronectin type 3 domain-containing protein
MLNNLRKSKEKIFLFIFLQLPVLTVMFLTGCGGNANIPPADILDNSQVTLMWKDGGGSVAYNIYASKSPGVTVFNSYEIPHVTSPFTLTNLEPGDTYYFMITAEDGSGRIWKSKEKSYTVVNKTGSIQFGDILSRSRPNATVATAKKKAKAAAAETRDVTLQWNEVPNATSYNIYWSDKPGVAKKNGTKISNVKSPYKITGLKKGKTYYFVVTAVNASAESKESQEISYAVGK